MGLLSGGSSFLDRKVVDRNSITFRQGREAARNASPKRYHPALNKNKNKTPFLGQTSPSWHDTFKNKKTGNINAPVCRILPGQDVPNKSIDKYNLSDTFCKFDTSVLPDNLVHSDNVV